MNNRSHSSARSQAIKELGKSKRVNELLRIAWDESMDDKARSESITELGNSGCAIELMVLVQNEATKQRVREKAAKTLARTHAALELIDDHHLRAIAHIEAAERSIRGFSDRELIPDLERIALDPKMDIRIRSRASELLYELGAPDKASIALMAIVLDEQASFDWKRNSASKLAREAGADAGAKAWLAIAIDEKIKEIDRWDAIEALGELGREKDLRDLACNSAVDLEIRIKAAGQLAKLGNANSITRAWLALLRDTRSDERVLRYATLGLGEFADVSVLPELGRIAKNHKDSFVRYHADQAIESIRKRTG